MGKFSRNKGVRGERELASKLRELGIDGAYRSRQFCGSASSADVIGIPGIHAEVKRCERLSLYASYEQVLRDATGTDDIPTVFHRRNGQRWLAVLSLKDWAKLYQGYMGQQVKSE